MIRQRKGDVMTADPVTLEETRTLSLQAASDQAAAARDDARRNLVLAKLDDTDEQQQKPLLDRLVTLTADADAAAAAVEEHQRQLDEMRNEANARAHRAQVEALEAELADARERYATAFSRLEPMVHSVDKELERMALARNAERSAAIRMAKLQGAYENHTTAFMEWTRLPNASAPRMTPFGSSVPAFVDSHRPR